MMLLGDKWQRYYFSFEYLSREAIVFGDTIKINYSSKEYSFLYTRYIVRVLYWNIG